MVVGASGGTDTQNGIISRNGKKFRKRDESRVEKVSNDEDDDDYYEEPAGRDLETRLARLV